MPTQDEQLRARIEAQETIRVVERELLRRTAPNNFISFVRYTFPDYKADRFHEEVARHLDLVSQGALKRLMIFAPPQHGKQIANKTPILTTRGWKTHGELIPGDFVYGRNGFPVKIIAVSNEQEQNCEIEFSDGETIGCHANHEWIVADRSGHRPIERIVETKELMAYPLFDGDRGRGTHARYLLDKGVCIENPDIVLPVDPYYLGAWLGDGTTTSNCITHHPDDIAIINKIVSRGISITSTNIHATSGVYTTRFGSMNKILKSNKLIGHKHIPGIYYTSSIEQRLELLAGLIDTDGSVYQKNGRVTFSNTNKTLIRDVVRLISTFGWRCSVSEFEPILSSSGIQGTKTTYQVGFNPTLSFPTALDRKKITKITPDARRRSVVSVRKTWKEMGKCIQVEGGVYLVGDRLIPTHNSQLVSVHFPLYYLSHHPEDPIILASYGSDLAESKSRQARELIANEGSPFRNVYPEIQLSTKSKAINRWQLKGHRGTMLAVGAGGPITGHGAALGIIDDPIANWEAAQSQHQRNTVYEWFRTTFRTRVWENGAIVIILTRWHEDDVAGRILNSDGGKDWTVLRFPAIAEDETERAANCAFLGIPDPGRDQIGRAAGEALAPSRYSINTLNEIKRDVGSLAWAAEYQQVPRPAEGARFKREWFSKIVENAPTSAKRVRYWDKAATERDRGKKDRAATAGVLLAVAPDGLVYVEDAIQGWWSVGEREDIILRTAQEDSVLYNGRVRIYFEQEPGSGGKESAEATLRNLMGHSARADRPTGSKDTRIEPFAVQAEAGRVRLVRGAWNRSYVEEMIAVPFGARRDQADATAGAFAKLASGGLAIDRVEYSGLWTPEGTKDMPRLR